MVLLTKLFEIVDELQSPDALEADRTGIAGRVSVQINIHAVRDQISNIDFLHRRVDGQSAVVWLCAKATDRRELKRQVSSLGSIAKAVAYLTLHLCVQKNFFLFCFAILSRLFFASFSASKISSTMDGIADVRFLRILLISAHTKDLRNFLLAVGALPTLPRVNAGAHQLRDKVSRRKSKIFIFLEFFCF